jgi:hypothetical protein
MPGLGAGRRAGTRSPRPAPRLLKVDDDPDTGDPRFRIGEVLDRATKIKFRKPR